MTTMADSLPFVPPRRLCGYAPSSVKPAAAAAEEGEGRSGRFASERGEEGEDLFEALAQARAAEIDEVGRGEVANLLGDLPEGREGEEHAKVVDDSSPTSFWADFDTPS
ncbi:MAG: hypothetical protein SGPRY_004563, partial [Prymnesium sp.]